MPSRANYGARTLQLVSRAPATVAYVAVSVSSWRPSVARAGNRSETECRRTEEYGEPSCGETTHRDVSLTTALPHVAATTFASCSVSDSRRVSSSALRP